MNFKERIRSHPWYKPIQRGKAYITRFTHPVGHPLYKISVIKSYAKKFKLDILVETGTNLGYTLECCQNSFKQLYSVELDDALYERAMRHFRDPKIHLFHDDSSSFLKKLSLHEPVIYWLDAHYCEMESGEQTAGVGKDSPITAELETCFEKWESGSVVLIDDAHYFGSDGTYPSMDKIDAMAGKLDLRVEVIRDIIRITA
jgi:hypothetical protein